MSFLTLPLLLGGLAAGAIPVILHLIMRGVPKKYEFPALRFIQKKLKVNERKFKLKHLLLLALRILAFLLLGLALARPILDLSSWGDANSSSAGSFASQITTQEAPVAAVFLFDTSPRMDYTQAGTTRLEEAKKMAGEILSRLPPESRIAVIGSDRSGNEGYQVDSHAAAARIERLRIIAAERPVAEMIPDAIALLHESELPDRELYIFTDLTEPGWPREIGSSIRRALDELEAEMEHPPGICLADLGVANPHDTAIDNLKLSHQILSAQSRIRFDLELAHIGRAEERIAELLILDPNRDDGSDSTVFDPEKAEKRISKHIIFQEGESKKSETFELSGFAPGTYQGIIRFNKSDALALNDQVPFTFEVQQPWKILIAAEPPIRDNARFLRNALDPALLRQSGFSPFDVTIVEMKELEEMRPEAMLKYRAIMILDPAGLRPTSWAKFSDYASNGNGLGVFLGRNLSRAPDSFSQPAAVEVLGAKVGLQVRRPEGLQLSPDDYQTPVLSVFRELGNLTDEIPWDALPVYRYYNLREIEESAYIALKYSDARPAVIVRPLGNGYTLLMTTPVSDNPNHEPWNLLPVGDGGDSQWVFVALMDGIGRLLVGAGDRSYNFTAGQLALIKPNEERIPESCVLMLPGGENVRISTDTAMRTISYSATERIGNYRVRSGGDALTVDSGFSILYRPGQMDLIRVGTERLDEILGKDKYRLIHEISEYVPFGTRGKTASELFPLLAILLCIFFVAEYIFANRFYAAPGED